MHDLLIKGGYVVDGSGGARQLNDVAIQGGRIVAIGNIKERAKRILNVDGCIVAPGFVDIHTHYDAQIFWDPVLSPSPFHGVTTVMGGNCGFSIAPLSGNSDDAQYLKRMLARVEGMPLESLEEGVPWHWQSFGEYLDAATSKCVAVNAGFLVGHSAIRRTVMGTRATGNEATPEELKAMCALLLQSMREGGMGFSTSLSPTHNDMEGQPVPSRFASHEELLALAATVSEVEGTTLEVLPGVGAFDEETQELMGKLSLAANRPLNWNVLAPSSLNPDLSHDQLKASDTAERMGGKVVALSVPEPMKLRINLRSGFIFDSFPQWAAVIGQPLEDKKKSFQDSSVRKRLDAAAHSEEAGVMAALANWEAMTIDEVFSDEYRQWKGRTVGELASSQGKEPFDAMLDLALAEDLRTSFSPPVYGDDEESWQLRGSAWHDERVVIGASDAGAHLDMLDTFAFSTKLLALGMRKHKLITLEEAVRQLTDIPAKLYGIKERGLIRSGWHADLAIFDEERVDCGPTYTRHDLPANATRLYADALGMHYVVVNGEVLIDDEQLSDERSGKILRAGQDTTSVKVKG